MSQLLEINYPQLVINEKGLVGDHSHQLVLVVSHKALVHLYRDLGPFLSVISLQVLAVGGFPGMHLGLEHLPRILNGFEIAGYDYI